MFFSGLRESTSAEPIELRNIPARTFEYLLHYIATDEYPDEASNVHDATELTAAAEMFMMDDLRRISIDTCISFLQPETFFAVLAAANRYGLTELVSYCVHYAPDHLTEIAAVVKCSPADVPQDPHLLLKFFFAVCDERMI